MKQLQGSMDVIRTACIPKTKVNEELVDGLKIGNFPDNRNLKCYTQCVAQMGGIVSLLNFLSRK